MAEVEGLIERLGKCPRCEGRGYIWKQLRPGKHDCPSCKGTGRAPKQESSDA